VKLKRLAAGGAVALLSGAAWAAPPNPEQCGEFESTPQLCAEKLRANGWSREFKLPSKTVDAGVDYDLWRNGRDVMLCLTYWGRGKQPAMICDQLDPVVSGEVDR
jgi:hypothetical protein